MKSYSIETAFDVGDKFIVDNLIARKSISLIVASPKKGKTALGLDLGLCIHEGVINANLRMYKNDRLTMYK